LDLVVTNYFSNTVSVLLGNGNGTFQTAQNFASGSNPHSVAVGDLNGDGLPDLAVANRNSGTVSVLLGNGNGTFQAAQNFAMGDAPRSVSVGDLTGDGRLDLAVANYFSNTVSVLVGNGNGTFQAVQNFATGSGPESVALGDVNGDGRLDLAVTNKASDTVSVLLGNANGTFLAAQSFATGDGPVSVSVGDVNRDGRLDLTVANLNDNSVSVLLGNGNGTFQTAQNFATGTQPRFVSVGDVNGDGRLDLAVANASSNTVSVLLGNGNGTFRAAQNFATEVGPSSVAVGDVNGDGRPDLAIPNNVSNTMSVLQNAANGDFTGQTRSVDTVAPSVVSIIADPTQSGTNVDNPRFVVTFSEDVTGVDATDFVAVPGAGVLVAPGPVAVTGSGRTYTVTVNGVSGVGSLGLNLADDNSIRDLAGNRLVGNGNGMFQAAQTFATGTNPFSVSVGDVNGDGHLDLALANFNSATVSLLLGNGNGTFQAAANFATGTSPQSVAIGDLNGDGRLDLAVANASSSTVSVLLGNGNGTFQAAQNFATGSTPQFVSIGDVNGDGHLDLAIANQNSNAVSVLLGNGNGTFQAATNFATGNAPQSVVIGDINGDGRLDLAVANRNSASVSALIGNGNGTFQAAQNFATGALPIFLAFGDVNGDGRLDLAVTNYGGNTASVLLGNGNGAFQAAQNFATGASPASLVVDDVNGDGHLDLAVANYNGGTVSVLLGNGNGSFQAAQSVGTGGAAPVSVASGDMSGDGRLDLVIANRNSNTVSVLLNAANGNFTGQTRPVDTIAPTITSVLRQDPLSAVTGADQLMFRVTFSEAVQNVSTGDFTLGGTSAADGIVSSVASVSASVYEVLITGVTNSNGTIQLVFAAGQNIADLATNAITNTTPSISELYTVANNRSPTALALGNATIAENVAIGTGIGTFTTTDPDASNTFTYSLVEGTGATDNAAFQIVGNELRTNAALDFESKSSYTIRVRTTDQGVLPFEQVFTITVTDVNEPVSAPISHSITVAENSSAATVVGAISNANYLFFSDEDTASIRRSRLDGSEVVTIVSGLDRPRGVFVDDRFAKVYWADATGPTARFQRANFDGSSVETVATVSAATTTLNTFVVDSANGVLYFTNSTAGRIERIGLDGLNQTTLVSGLVAPVGIAFDASAGKLYWADQTAVRRANLNGSSVEVVIATGGRDIEIDAARALFVIATLDNRVLRANLDGTNAVTLATTGGEMSQLGLDRPRGRVYWTDLVQDRMFRVDLAGSTPVAVITSGLSLPRDVALAGGPSAAFDPDLGQTPTFSIVGGTLSGSFAINPLFGQISTSGTTLDFESSAQGTLVVRVTDPNAPTSFRDTDVVVTITNVNEQPTALFLSANTIAENVAMGTGIGSFTTTDPDAANTFTYTLVAGTGSTDNASFEIVGNELRTNTALDFETRSSYSIRIRTTDQGSLTFEQTFTITVTNVNEQPTALALSNATIAENVATGTGIGTFSTTDPDASNTFTYSLVSGTGSTDNASFQIVGDRLQTNTALDFETKSSFSIRIRTIDQNGLTFEQQFTITVTNVNEAPTALVLSASTIAENSDSGALIGTFTTTDPDAGNNFGYSLVVGAGSTDNGSFEIVGNQLRSNQVFNFEAKPSYTIRVRTTDQGGLSFEQTFTVVVTNVNDAPTLDATGNPFVILGAGSRQSTEMRQGVLVSDLLARGNPISDPDAGALRGIALTAIDRTLGSFQFTLVTNDPQEIDWVNVDAAGALSETSALLLPTSARLRFSTDRIPHHASAPFFLAVGSKLDAGLTFRAWDQTSGIAGGRANTATNGGSSAFSATSETSKVYFEVRLFRSFNPNASLNVYTLEAEFNALTGGAFQDRSTSAYTGFTVLLSPVPELGTSALFRLYFGIQFNDNGTEVDMGYRYLTSNGAEAEFLESIGPTSKRPQREGTYFRELGVSNGTATIGYVFTTQQPGTSELTQIYRTDVVNKPTRPPGTVEGGTPTSFTPQENGDHVYTTNTVFETTKFGTWRIESTRGFVRELNPNPVSGAATAAAMAEQGESAPSVGSQTTPAPARARFAIPVAVESGVTSTTHLLPANGVTEHVARLVAIPSLTSALVGPTPTTESIQVASAVSRPRSAESTSASVTTTTLTHQTSPNPRWSDAVFADLAFVTGVLTAV
jgi:hypothetical protein